MGLDASYFQRIDLSKLCDNWFYISRQLFFGSTSGRFLIFLLKFNFCEFYLSNYLFNSILLNFGRQIQNRGTVCLKKTWRRIQNQNVNRMNWSIGSLEMASICLNTFVTRVIDFRYRKSCLAILLSGLQNPYPCILFHSKCSHLNKPF